jgi:hypothetical protein
VGERPATGGRVRQFNSDAERARAWRERQRERRQETPGTAVPPALAEATLVSVLERLVELYSAHQATAGDLTARVEEAIAALADPEAVAEEMETVRAETARQVAESQERLARAQQAKAAAENAAREAENAANAAWEQTETLAAELEQARSARREAEAAGAAALQAQRVAYEQAGAELVAGHERTVRQVEEEAAEALQVAEARVTEAEARATQADYERARAEGVTAEIRHELDRTRGELTEMTESLPARLEAAQAAVAENLGIRHRLEIEAATANYEGHVGRLEAQLETATAQVSSAERIAQVYQREAERLGHQFEQWTAQREDPTST